ncbi:MAG: VWA domain-containing protein [Gordonia sp. (in: high G+C Gram-positive bacteria)]|uniref:VWA domain-containing protein n=1 Tax=Gordonia sp. (in: high G+C Gram-positive bacteria) TaxID=84139 RepID=UPI003BB6A90F
MYPFSAVVGQDRLKLALILCAVSPGIGGVLIRGEKGTAKSTIVRGLQPVLSGPARVVELPIGATEDRVIGSLDLTRVLRDGQAHFTPGLLAQADGGVLYIDEVNLLSDHLVDVLLDAAASGRVTIERDGVSHEQSADFVLVGTMNPEEGELRPQLLDRFGLVVDVAGTRDVDERVAIVTARMAYDADPTGFVTGYAAAEAELAQGISAARDAIGAISIPMAELRRIAAICAALEVDGLRGDIVVTRTAAAHAAWRGAPEVTEADVKVAVELALPHRRRRNPFDEPGMDAEELDDAMEQGEQAASADSPGEPPPFESEPDSGNDPDSGADSAEVDAPDDAPADDPPGPWFGATGFGSATRLRSFQVSGLGDGDDGRRSKARSRRGMTSRAIDFARETPVHLFATVLAAAGRSGGDGLPAIEADDLRGAERIGTESNLVVFVVDLSGSMTARARLAAVRTACVDLLRDSYTRRDRVAVIVAAGKDAYVAVPPTRSVDLAVSRLAAVRTGGRTPLAEGLQAAFDVIERAERTDPSRRPLLVVLTDGRATAGADAPQRASAVADRIARRGVSSLVIDCEQGFIRLGLATDLAARLGAQYASMGDLEVSGVASRLGAIG